MIITMRSYLCLILSFFVLSMTSAIERIVIAPPQSESDASFEYYKEVLVSALELTKEKFGDYTISFSSSVVSQGRAEVLLNQRGGLTVHRMGTDLIRETKLIAIRVPLNKGLLGVRLLLTNEKSNKKISSGTIENIKKMRACQGTHWPDTVILRDNGFNIIDTPHYENMFKMLDHGRCDFFPRSIVEGTAEYKSVKKRYTNIRINKQVLLSYDFPMYFFLGKNNMKVAKRIGEGLILMSRNGDLQRILEKNSSTTDAFPLKKWSSYKIIKLKNAYLSKKTPVNDKTLWSRIPKSKK